MDGKEGNFSALTSTYGKADTTIIKKKKPKGRGRTPQDITSMEARGYSTS